MNEPVEFDVFTQAICISHTASEERFSQNDTFVAKWTKNTNQVVEARSRFIYSNDCNEIMGGKLQNEQGCSSQDEVLLDPCDGDSGRGRHSIPQSPGFLGLRLGFRIHLKI